MAFEYMEACRFDAVPLTLSMIAAEVVGVNIEKGWRPAGGGPGTNTFGDYIALLHSEVSEALEAYRDHRLEDATKYGSCVFGSCDYHPHKPEGVGSELADVLIRLVDMADVFGIDLEAEYRRKIAYNRTRPYQHGGRTLAEDRGPQREPGRGKARLGLLRDAMPTDPRGWWTGEETDHFLDRWATIDLPEIVMADASGETLTLWCTDVRRAAPLVDMADHVGNDEGFTITRGEYEVCIVQTETKGTENDDT